MQSTNPSHGIKMDNSHCKLDKSILTIQFSSTADIITAVIANRRESISFQNQINNSLSQSSVITTEPAKSSSSNTVMKKHF
jgi:hypothetical protein